MVQIGIIMALSPRTGLGAALSKTRAHTMEHLPFSAHGLFFLSGVWIRGS